MKLEKILLISTLIITAACSKQAAPSAIPQDARIEQQVEELIAKMTLDEKVGQMTELAIDVLGDFVDGEFQLDDAKLHKAIAEFKVGSFLNAPGPVAQNREKWNEIISRIQEMSMKEIGIPCIYGLDQNHGTTYTLDGTLFHRISTLPLRLTRTWHTSRQASLLMRRVPATARGHIRPRWIWHVTRVGLVYGKILEKIAW